MPSTARPIRVGVIGLGFMGATHIAAYQRAAKDNFPCRLAAVADRRPHRRAGELWDVGGNAVSDTATRDRAFDPATVKGYETADQLLADPEIDLVSICTPTDTHVDLGIAALRAGKHVLIEKPIALTADEARRLATAASRSDKLVMPAMCMRFWPAWKWLKDRIDDRAFGKLLAVTFTRLSTAPTWNPKFYANGARSGGALFDLHIHDADFVRFCFGQPAAVHATGYTGDSAEIDHVVTSYHFTSDNAPRYVVAEGGWDQHPGFAFRMRYVARFETATADFDLTRADPLLLCHQGHPIPVVTENLPVHDDQSGHPAPVAGPTRVVLENLSGYDGQVRHFLSVITGSERSLLATMDDAVAVTALLQAERESARSGKPVTL